jgi:hypothetical protein
MTSEVICDCGIIFNHQADVEWHRTTEGHLWNKLKKEMDGIYIRFARSKIPENAKCDICGEQADLKTLLRKRKKVPDWYMVADIEKLRIRCKKCKRERLYLIKARFAKSLRQRAVAK